MSTVLKKLSFTIAPFHRKTALTRRKQQQQQQQEKRTKEEEKIVKKVAFQLDLGAPNNNEEYIKKIEDRIILKLVTPGLSTTTTKDTEDSGEDAKPTKVVVEHIEDKDEETNKSKERAKDNSKRLNNERIKKMVELDEMYFKYAVEDQLLKQKIVHKQVYYGHGSLEHSNEGGHEQPIEISYPTTEVIGHGSFGVVFTTTIKETDEMVAIKKVLQDRRFKNRELEIMKLLKHTNIIDLKYYFYEKDPHGEVYLNLILDFMPQSLYQRLRHFVHLTSAMPRLEIKCYMYQLFKALNYLHHYANVCHRDIKPQNLLVDPQSWELKLCDFGSAKQLKPTEPNVSYICSRYYRAPELIFGATNYTNQIDVWSSGCVMAELLLGQPMFPGESGIDQLVEIIKILGTPSKQEICAMNPNYMEHKFPQIKPIPLSKVFKKEDDPTVEFLTNMLRYDPLERFNSLQCLCSTYFDELRYAQDDLKEIVDNLKLLSFDYETELGHLTNDQLAAVKLRLMPSII